MTVQQQYVLPGQWQPPPQPALFGELSPDGTQVILIGQGSGWDHKLIGERLAHLTALLKYDEDHGRRTGVIRIPATWASVTQVAWSFNGANGTARWVPLPRLREWILDEFTRRTAPPEPLKAEFPPWLKLRPYQEDGAAMIAAARRFLLLDDPGVGKTVSAIAGLAEIQARGGDIFPMLIVTPSWDVVDVWKREIAKWMPGWRTVLWGGVSGGVRDIGEALDRAGILLTTYATNRIDADSVKGPLAALRPVTVVGDECHMVKGTALYTAKGNSTVSAAYRRVCAHAVNVIELSGTLITQDTGDVYVPMAAAWQEDFPDRKRFTDRYLRTSRAEYGEPKVEGLHPLAEPEFRAVMTGSMRRVSKADVLTQLPPKIYSVRYVDIPPEWRAAYDGMERDMLAELPDSDDELPAWDSLTRFGRLSQLACSAANVEVTEEPDAFGFLKKHYQVTLRAPSWKADVLLEILAERRGHPVAVFAPSRQLIEIAGQSYLEKAGYKVGYVTGTTARRARTAAIDGFQAGQLDVIALTTGAGGTGITLTAAGTLVFLQRPWLGESIQSEDRGHRIGSEIHEHGVEIIDIVARNTIDSRRRELLRDHAGQLADFVQDVRIVRDLLGGKK
jgi:SNF2 family DNA or RNA helicase